MCDGGGAQCLIGMGAKYLYTTFYQILACLECGVIIAQMAKGVCTCVCVCVIDKQQTSFHTINMCTGHMVHVFQTRLMCTL